MRTSRDVTSYLRSSILVFFDPMLSCKNAISNLDRLKKCSKLQRVRGDLLTGITQNMRLFASPTHFSGVCRSCNGNVNCCYQADVERSPRVTALHHAVQELKFYHF